MLTMFLLHALEDLFATIVQMFQARLRDVTGYAPLKKSLKRATRCSHPACSLLESARFDRFADEWNPEPKIIFVMSSMLISPVE